MKTITLTSNYNFESGYRQILKVLLNEFHHYNYDIIPRSYSNITEDFASFFDRSQTVDYSDKIDLSLLGMVNENDGSNPLLHIQFNRPRILYTMWESTRINDLLVEILNNFICIIVPNNYNKENLIKQGCTTRIEVVPLFCDTDFYSYQPHYDRDDFHFGTANEDSRKNINKIQDVFLKAFKNNNKIKLHVKTCKKNDVRYISSNIFHVNKKISREELKNWYYNLDVYVSGATCEGWGMMQHESMCCGRPIIYTHYGGLKEFVNQNVAYSVKYKEVLARYAWGNSCGKWSEFDEDDMIEKMIYCYNNKDDIKHKGYLASKQAGQFTKENFLKKLDNILSEYI